MTTISFRLSILTLSISCAFISVAHGVDGRAVSDQSTVVWPSLPGGDIILYEIRNSDVVSNRKLYDGKGATSSSTSTGRYPVISTDGSQVVFFRITSNGENFVTLVDATGGNPRDIVTIPSQSGFDAKGCMDWPRGPWIYYNMGDGTNGSKQVRRVNADDGRDEAVVTFGNMIWQWQMSADAARMHIRFSCSPDEGCQMERARYVIPGGDGTLTDWNRCGWGVGCGTTISPSGEWLQYIMGRHTWFGLNRWENAGAEPEVSVHCLDWNAWIANGLELGTSCAAEGGGDPIDVYVGCETESNRWSTNSDKWVCLRTGLPMDNATTGRYAFCGANQTLVNWVDSITVNVSKNPRSCGDPNWIPQCDNNWPGQFRRNEAGDFWVSGPIEDINEDLRDLVTSSRRVRKATSETGFSARVMASGLQVTLPGFEPWMVSLVDVKGRTFTTRRARIGEARFDISDVAGVAFVRAWRNRQALVTGVLAHP